jgi:hypothetical protein
VKRDSAEEVKQRSEEDQIIVDLSFNKEQNNKILHFTEEYSFSNSQDKVESDKNIAQ